MTSTLTVKDLIVANEPLDPAQVLTGEAGLDNAVSWVVSLRPYSPAFPRLRGGELALVAGENLPRVDPPLTLAEVVSFLVFHQAAAVAVKGEIGEADLEKATKAASEARLPLLVLAPEAPLADIEQAVMRECAMYQARSEMAPTLEPDTWFDDLLSGRESVLEGAVTRAERQGYSTSALYAVAFVTPAPGAPQGQIGMDAALRDLSDGLHTLQARGGARMASARVGSGLAVLLPGGSRGPLAGALASRPGLACGTGTARPLARLAESLAEAQLAAVASEWYNECAPTAYVELGASRLLLLLHRDQPKQLAAFVEETIGPLLKHDAQSATPLLPTVQAFIQHGGRLRETAEHLYVHRNTLAYRLERAAEVLGGDLKEPNARLAVELALRALPLIKEYHYRGR
jgi:PucR C-terminal helix-turn-helix domain/Purine catabolism regulatory protein-like family